MPTKGLK
jgi:hypothetical protein